METSPLQVARPTVLIVEDEPLVLDIVAEEFTDHGYLVIEATDGHAAIDALKGGRAIDLLFTDIRLAQGPDGWTVGETARALHPALPIIYATGFAADTERMVEDAVFLRKPYRPAEVIAAAARLGIG